LTSETAPLTLGTQLPNGRGCGGLPMRGTLAFRVADDHEVASVLAVVQVAGNTFTVPLAARGRTDWAGVSPVIAQERTTPSTTAQMIVTVTATDDEGLTTTATYTVGTVTSCAS
jgi:hypothetical protein